MLECEFRRRGMDRQVRLSSNGRDYRGNVLCAGVLVLVVPPLRQAAQSVKSAICVSLHPGVKMAGHVREIRLLRLVM